MYAEIVKTRNPPAKQHFENWMDVGVLFGQIYPVDSPKNISPNEATGAILWVEILGSVKYHHIAQ